jgi:cell division protein FtsB
MLSHVDTIAQTTRSNLESRPWFWILSLVGVILAWAVTQLRAVVEIRRLRVETTKLSTETQKLSEEREKLKKESAKLAAETQKLAVEVDKLRTDEVLAAANVLKQVLDQRSAGDSGHLACQQHLRALSIALKSGSKATAAENREQFCENLTLRVMTASRAEMELNQLRYRRNSEKYESYVVQALIPTIEQWTKWMKAINDQKLLDHLGSSPLRFSEQTCRGFQDAIDGVTDASRARVLLELEGALGRLKLTGA